MAARKIGDLLHRLLIPVAILFAAMAITGCGGGGSSTSGPSPAPNISVNQAQSDFGVVVLDKFADRDVEIRNSGNGNLTIGQITQGTPPDSQFSIVSDSCSGKVIPPSSSCGFTIRFAPNADGDYLARFNIPSNDSDAGLLTATFSGKGRALNLSINRVTLEDSTVTVVVSVGDRSDTPVDDLVKDNFSIFENGSPKSILNVSNIEKPPVSVGMVLDYSKSTIPYTSDLETAAKSFIDLLDPVNVEAEIIKFATVIATVQSFTNDKDLLRAAIDAPFPYERLGTFLYDAIWTSIESTSLRPNPQHAIIAVTDGRDDNESVKTIGEVIARAVEKNLQIYTIGVGIADNVSLLRLATDTGGQYFYVPDVSELASVYSTISEILSNEYTITYTTSAAAGSTISLDVKVQDAVGQRGEASRDVGL